MNQSSRMELRSFGNRERVTIELHMDGRPYEVDCDAALLQDNV